MAQAKQSMSSINSVLSIVVGAVALLNFFNYLFHFPLVGALKQVLDTYRAIIHGMIDWITWPLGFRVPGGLKDLGFLYGLVGGAFMRARLAEGVYPDQDNTQTIGTILRVLIKPKWSRGLIVVPGETGLWTSSRLVAAYRIAPPWLRKGFDLFLWPRVASQYWQRPMVYFAEYTATYQMFEAGYVPGPRKTFLYDRRVVFGVQAVVLVFIVFVIVVINGFLVPPAMSPN